MSVQTTDYFFEGAEKRLEVYFECKSNTPSGKSLLDVKEKKWSKKLNSVGCTIIDSRFYDQMNHFVLSESSLFVFPHRIMIKTCGQITLLNFVPGLVNLAAKLGLTVEAVSYSHKSFVQPWRQLHGYHEFDHEVAQLHKHFPTLPGRVFVLDSPNSPEDRWFCYQAFPTNSKNISSDQKIEIIMTGLDRKSMEPFYKSTFDEATRIKIEKIIPGSDIAAKLFDPCGYSMNGYCDSNKEEVYSTIHVTPEAGFSYVSYECDLKTTSYDDIIKRVLEVFNPNKLMIVVYAEKDAICKIENPFTANINGFTRTACTNPVLFSGTSRSIFCARYAR